MNCPFCNNKMVRGYMQSPRTPIFTTKPKALFCEPDEDDIILIQSSHFFKLDRTDAWNCNICKKVIIEYKE